MLNNVKKNVCTSFPFLSSGHHFNHTQEIFDTVQTMNISQTLNFSILLILMELANLISYWAVDIKKRLISPTSFAIVIFLLYMVFNIFYCDYLLGLERSGRTRKLLQCHTYSFTIMFSVFCLCMNYFCLKSRMSAESVLMFYIYLAAGPIYTYKEALAAVVTSLFLSQMRCRITGNNLRLLKEAWNEQIYLQDRADNDPLTQVLNRSGFSIRLEQLIPAAIQLYVPIAVIMVDIDYFKQYNDTFGHMAGDECLKKVAAALASRIHQGRDLICRFGGEEFQILLYGIKPEDALHAADRLRQAVADLKLPSADRRTAPYVTISVGVSSAVPSSMETYNGMIKAADDELYYAKNHGKNMVSFREMPPEKESVPSSVSVTRCVAISCELPRF